MSIGTPPVLTIIEPKPNQVEPAEKFQPTGDYGMLCLCHGIATPPAEGLMSDGVALIHQDPSADPPSEDDYKNASLKLPPVEESNGWRWNYDGQLDVNATDPAPAANNNTLWVGAIWVNTSTMQTQVQSGSVSYKGHKVDSCSTSSAKSGKSAKNPDSSS